MLKNKFSRFLKSAGMATCLAGSLVRVGAFEPFPPAAVDEWMTALEGEHDSFKSLTTPRMMLALAESDRLGEASAIIHKPGEEDVRLIYPAMEIIGDALTKLATNGHPQEAAKVDAGLWGAGPRLGWNREVFDSAMRMAHAGEIDALVRMAETLMLIPGCDRTKEFEVEREQAMGARTIELPPIDNPGLPRSTTLLPLLARVGAIARFRELAETRVAAVPEDFKSVRVLTLATLLDTGDDPALWQRIADADGFFRGRDLAALKDSMQLCYQFKIPAPHLCAWAERLYEEADHYQVSFGRVEFSLILATLWKDIGRIDETQRLHAVALDSLSKSQRSCSKMLERFSGVLVISLDDARLLPELDRWIARFTEILTKPNGRGDRDYRYVLKACEWALAMDLPAPVTERWFRFADIMAAEELKRVKRRKYPRSYALRWHFHLLLSTGRRERAREFLDSLARAVDGKKIAHHDQEELRARLAASGTDREALVIPDVTGIPIRSVRWAKGNNDRFLIANVYPGEAPPPGAGDDEVNVVGPNLIPSGWCWQRGSSISDSMVPWEVMDGTVRIGYRGGTFGGGHYELRSRSFALDAEHEYQLSGRIRAFGRAGVKLQFHNAEGGIVSTQKITEQISTSSPGERWFRVNLIRGASKRKGIRVPPQATAARLVLTNSLGVQGRWSDLFVGRLAEVD